MQNNKTYFHSFILFFLLLIFGVLIFTSCSSGTNNFASLTTGIQVVINKKDEVNKLFESKVYSSQIDYYHNQTINETDLNNYVNDNYSVSQKASIMYWEILWNIAINAQNGKIKCAVTYPIFKHDNSNLWYDKFFTSTIYNGTDFELDLLIKSKNDSFDLNSVKFIYNQKIICVITINGVTYESDSIYYANTIINN